MPILDIGSVWPCQVPARSKRPVLRNDAGVVEQHIFEWRKWVSFRSSETDCPTQNETHHESSLRRVTVGAADRVSDRNPGLTHGRPNHVSQGNAARSTG